MAISNVNINELQNDISNVQSSNLERLRVNINFSKRKIIALQRSLMSLKSAEMLVLQRMNRMMKMENVQKFLPSDRYISQDPLQSITPTDIILPDPDARVSNSRRHLGEGMESQKAELDRKSVV